MAFSMPGRPPEAAGPGELRGAADSSHPERPPAALAHVPRQQVPPARRAHQPVRWSEFGHGGHLAALETAEAPVTELREFFGSLR
ncbi:hypothetical protein AB0I80_12335 [Nonomuraea rubra]